MISDLENPQVAILEPFLTKPAKIPGAVFTTIFGISDLKNLRVMILEAFRQVFW